MPHDVLHFRSKPLRTISGTRALMVLFTMLGAIGTLAHASLARERPPTWVVAADGSGDFETVQAAVDAVPADADERVVILIRPGMYKERIHVPKDKPPITFCGETRDPREVVLTNDWNARRIGPDGKEIGTFQSYSTHIAANDFIAENLTFENTAGEGAQALAVNARADRLVFRNCRFLGWQDTLLAHSGRQYYENCYIKGRVDFIFGGATAVFDRCTIHSKNGGYITAASTKADQPYGFVFLDCTLTGEGEPAYLGRPWRPHAMVAFIRCHISDHIRPEGWDNWRNPANERTTRYYEYACTGPGADQRRRVPRARTLTEQAAERMTPRNILSGKDGWNPEQSGSR